MTPRTVLDAGRKAAQDIPHAIGDLADSELDAVFRAMLRALAEDFDALTMAAKALHETEKFSEWCFIDGADKTEYCRKVQAVFVALAENDHGA